MEKLPYPGTLPSALPPPPPPPPPSPAHTAKVHVSFPSFSLFLPPHTRTPVKKKTLLKCCVFNAHIFDSWMDARGTMVAACGLVRRIFRALPSGGRGRGGEGTVHLSEKLVQRILARSPPVPPQSVGWGGGGSLDSHRDRSVWGLMRGMRQEVPRAVDVGSLPPSRLRGTTTLLLASPSHTPDGKTTRNVDLKRKSRPATNYTFWLSLLSS